MLPVHSLFQVRAERRPHFIHPRWTLLPDPEDTAHSHSAIRMMKMHGLGDSPKSFISLVPSLFGATTKVVLLQAPQRKVSINQGQASSSWFDIRGFDTELDLKKLISMKELEESCVMVTKVLKEECAIVPSSKVFLGGFSQGCILALYAGLKFEEKLCGIFGFSGFLVPDVDLEGVNKDTPKFLSHGEFDYMIPWFIAKKSYKRLEDANTRVEVDKQLDHAISQKQIEWVKQWAAQQMIE